MQYRFKHTPDFVKKIHNILPKEIPYLSTSKGIHVKSHMLVSDAIKNAMNGRSDYGKDDHGIVRPEIPLVFFFWTFIC